VKADADVLAELMRLAGKVPMPVSGLTDKNKRRLRQFDDPAVLQRLFNFPSRLWAEVKRDAKPNVQTLVKAQAALAIGILSYMPIRLHNLAMLTFDEDLFLREGPRRDLEPGIVSQQGEEPDGAGLRHPFRGGPMLIEYRTALRRKSSGIGPTNCSLRADGTPKNQWSVAWLIRTYLKRRVGIELLLTNSPFERKGAA